MTDAELIDKRLAGPTEEEQCDLMTWEAAAFTMHASMTGLFYWFSQLPIGKETVDELHELDLAFSNDETLIVSKELAGLCATYGKYVECGQDCQNIHEQLYWTGKTKRIPIEYLTTLYNRWLEKQQAKSQ